MNCDQHSRRVLLRVAFALTLLTSATTTAFAQDIAKPAAEKWRPKDGLYAEPGADLNERCMDHTEILVELGEMSISGNEWSCKIKKLTETAPGTIRLDMTCYDYNLALFINGHDPNAYEREFKEIMLLRKIDAKSMFVRKTQNGKFKDPDWRASYCPEEAQRAHTEAKAKDLAEAERKAAEERSRPKPWRPLDGVYAIPGADLNDRCLKSGDATIELAEKSISSGADKCKVFNIADTPPEAIKMGVICNQEPRAPGAVVRNVAGQLIFEPPGSETMILRKIDDKTIFLQKTRNGNFIEPGEQLSYCGQDVQRTDAQQKVKK